MSYTVESLATICNARGDAFVQRLLSSFSCRYNSEIDGYLRNRALDFSRKSMTVTHLVFDDDTRRFVGYFALTHKPVVFHANNMSATQRKRVERFAKLNPETGTYTVSTFLIAQIGKNYLVEDGNLISGEALLALAERRLLIAKEQVGGQIVFVEMEHGNEQLAKFYSDNGFVLFGSRDDVEDGKPITYDQLFLFLK